MKNILNFCVLMAIVFIFAGCSANGNTAMTKGIEKPEEVVKKFYSYVAEGGPTTLREAYKLISTKHYKMNEEQFKGVVSNYSKDMKVNIISSDIKKDLAVVTIEYSMPSALGGSFTAQSDMHLELDAASKSWKIDFTGETYDNETGQTATKL
ncbi:MAG: hypothetical protein A2073_02650 [Deltaproteobacteria bacterium GWC2_42_11]|nr:MAG: hypothetical protein A2073_02650 [Deltaproteobacteria bacterium GWC2_42_11]HBO83829.1 hypothetical protein [Deltaproteobacteria bacterium]